MGLGRVPTVVHSVFEVSAGQLCMVCCHLVFARLVMPCGFPMVPCRVFVMLCCLVMMLRCLFST
jgi:hypothetical protein